MLVHSQTRVFRHDVDLHCKTLMSTLGSRKMQVLEHEYVLLTLFHQSQSKLTRNILSEKTAETLHRDNDSMPPVPGASCLFMSSCPSQSLVAKERELGNLRKVDREARLGEAFGESSCLKLQRRFSLGTCLNVAREHKGWA